MDFILDYEALSSNDPMFGTNKGNPKAQQAYMSFRNSTYYKLVKIHGKQKTEGRTAWKFERFYGKTKKGCSRKPYDHANLVGGFKPVIDSMESMGLVDNDNTRLFKAYYFQKPTDQEKGYVKITQLDPRGEVVCAFEELASIFEISEGLLLEVAKETKLTKGEK